MASYGDVNPVVDKAGRVRYARSSADVGLLTLLIGWGPLCLVWLMSPAYGMPGLSEPWDNGRDLYLWAIPGLVFAVTVPVSLFLLCWRCVLAFDRNSRTVCVETRVPFRTERETFEYKQVHAEVMRKNLVHHSGATIVWYELSVGLPGTRMFLSSSQDADRVEEAADRFGALTGLECRRDARGRNGVRPHFRDNSLNVLSLAPKWGLTPFEEAGTTRDLQS